MERELEALKKGSQYRFLVDSGSPTADGWIERSGQRVLNLASNHYLGLDLPLEGSAIEEMSCWAEAIGSSLRTGSTASRLIVGNDPVYTLFERELAEFKGTGSTLLFSSGYMANLGVISALAGRGDLVFSDKLNHASIVDGITLSRAEHVRYRHRDMDHLEAFLKKADPGKRKIIVTDAVFSMDGSLAPLQTLVELKNKYGAILIVDEAHSGGVFGIEGQGLVHELGLTDQVEVQMGTFSKAYGSCGAYIAGDRILIDYLINKSRSLIYNTALPTSVVWASYRNWQTARREGWRRLRLLELSEQFRDLLRDAGFDTGASECQIVPVILGTNELAVQFGRLLEERRIAAVAIRPPTVPEGTARIRFTLMATHLRDDLQEAVQTMIEAGRELGLISSRFI